MCLSLISFSNPSSAWLVLLVYQDFTVPCIFAEVFKSSHGCDGCEEMYSTFAVGILSVQSGRSPQESPFHDQR